MWYRRLLGVITKKDVLRHVKQMDNEDPSSVLFNWAHARLARRRAPWYTHVQLRARSLIKDSEWSHTGTQPMPVPCGVAITTRPMCCRSYHAASKIVPCSPLRVSRYVVTMHSVAGSRSTPWYRCLSTARHRVATLLHERVYVMQDYIVSTYIYHYNIVKTCTYFIIMTSANYCKVQ